MPAPVIETKSPGNVTNSLSAFGLGSKNIVLDVYVAILAAHDLAFLFDGAVSRQDFEPIPVIVVRVIA